MNTFIAVKADGSKLGFMEGKCKVGFTAEQAALREAKYCTCDENTTNISEISDWETAEDVSYEIE